MPMQPIVKDEKWIESEGWRKNTYIVSITQSTRLCGTLLTSGRSRHSPQLCSVCLAVGQDAMVVPEHQGGGGDIGERPLAGLLREKRRGLGNSCAYLVGTLLHRPPGTSMGFLNIPRIPFDEEMVDM
jgi:hypothetical protein